MNRFFKACFLCLLSSQIIGQTNEDSIQNKFNEYYLTGCFQEGLTECAKVLEKPDQLSEKLSAFIKIKQGLFLKDADRFREAIPIFAQLETDLSAKGDTSSETYLELIQHYSFALSSNTQWDLAEKFAEKALNACRIKFGVKHPLYALAIFHLGYVYNHRRQYAKAEKLLLEAAALQKSILGEKHRDYAQTIHFLGGINLNKAEFDLARQYYSSALAIRRQVFNCAHPRIAALIMNLGLTEAGQGRLEEAEKWFRSAVQELNLLGAFSWGTACTNNYNLANVLISLGRYAEARSILIQNIDLTLKVRGADHPDNAMNLQSIGLTYQHEGRFPEAKQSFEDALILRERVLGKKHPHYAESLGTLANIAIEQRDWNEATRKSEAATLCMQEIQGEAHPDYAQNLFNLGYAQFYAGQQDIGIKNAQAALSILQKALGVEHPHFIRLQFNWAQMLKALGRFDEVFRQVQAVSVQQQKLLLRASTYLPENDLETYTYEFSQDLARQFSLLAPMTAQASWEDQDGLYYDGLLFYKGFVAQQVFQLRNFIRSQADTSLQTKLNRWQQVHRQIGQEYAKSISSRSANVQELEASAAALEKELVQNARSFAQLRQEVHWSDIQKHLKPKEAAIEFFLYQTKDGAERSYAAAILRPGWDNPKVVQLGTSTALDQALGLTLQSWLKDQRGIEPVKANFPHTIYELIWQPLEVFLQDVKTIYYSPIGGLNTLPLHAIPTGKGKQLLMHRYQLVLLNSTRTIIDSATDQMDKIRSAVLLGGVNYDQSTNNKSILQTTNGAHLRSQMALRSVPNWQDVSWGNLPGAATEVVEIEGLLKKQGVKTTLLMDSSATEGQIKSLLTKGGLAPDLIHFATHGFAFRDTLQRTGLHYSILHNPLLRTGLVLAGANQHQANDAGAVEDGILTAFEIKGFSLQGTQLVVLSACDSGLGEVRGEEGVFGLPRAFKMAGARNLLVSLWAAKDAETAQFMGHFYRNWIKGLTIREAFWQARAKMQKKYRDPRIWAGFVLWE